MADTKKTDEPIAAETEEKKLDKTVDGGKYIVGDRYVDADGKDLGPAPKKDRA